MNQNVQRNLIAGAAGKCSIQIIYLKQLLYYAQIKRPVPTLKRKVQSSKSQKRESNSGSKSAESFNTGTEFQLPLLEVIFSCTVQLNKT